MEDLLEILADMFLKAVEGVLTSERVPKKARDILTVFFVFLLAAGSVLAAYLTGMAGEKGVSVFCGVCAVLSFIGLAVLVRKLVKKK